MASKYNDRRREKATPVTYLVKSGAGLSCGSPSDAAKNDARSQPGATGVARRKYASYHFTAGK